VYLRHTSYPSIHDENWFTRDDNLYKCSMHTVWMSNAIMLLWYDENLELYGYRYNIYSEDILLCHIIIITANKRFAVKSGSGEFFFWYLPIYSNEFIQVSIFGTSSVYLRTSFSNNPFFSPLHSSRIYSLKSLNLYIIYRHLNKVFPYLYFWYYFLTVVKTFFNYISWRRTFCHRYLNK